MSKCFEYPVSLYQIKLTGIYIRGKEQVRAKVFRQILTSMMFFEGNSNMVTF